MWELYLYIAFIPICWIIGWAYVAYRKYHEVPANQVIDVEGITYISLFCSAIWPFALTMFILFCFAKVVWNLGAKIQDKLVRVLKNRYAVREKTYGESTYRQPPSAV
jgi:hypothetical protein